MSVILSRQGQLKIQQMTFMLLAVTLFFILVLLFYLAVKTAGLSEDALELEKDKAARLVTKIASSPEFGFEGVAKGVDVDKVMILRNNKEYENFWGIDGIIIRKLYPVAEDRECEFNNYPDCNIIKLFTNRGGAPISSYVSLCRKMGKDGSSYNQCEVGLMMIEVGDVDD